MDNTVSIVRSNSEDEVTSTQTGPEEEGDTTEDGLQHDVISLQQIVSNLTNVGETPQDSSKSQWPSEQTLGMSADSTCGDPPTSTIYLHVDPASSNENLSVSFICITDSESEERIYTDEEHEISTKSLLESENEMVISVLVDNNSEMVDSTVKEALGENHGKCETENNTAKEMEQVEGRSCTEQVMEMTGASNHLKATEPGSNSKNCMDEFLVFLGSKGTNDCEEVKSISENETAVDTPSVNDKEMDKGNLNIIQTQGTLNVQSKVGGDGSPSINRDGLKDTISDTTRIRKVIKKNVCPTSTMIQTSKQKDITLKGTEFKDFSPKTTDLMNDDREIVPSSLIPRQEKRKLDTSGDNIILENSNKRQCIADEENWEGNHEQHPTGEGTMVIDIKLESIGTIPSTYESMVVNEQSNLSIQDHFSESVLQSKDSHIGEDSVPESKVCYICFRDFSSKCKMEEHIRVEHSYFPFAPVNTCTHCGSCFNSCSEVSSHEYKTHSLTLSCPFCGILHRDKELLQMHVVIHLSPLTYVCMKCQEHFSTVDDVEFHIFKNHGESALWADYLKCRFCHCLFEKREKLYSHIINLHSRIFSHKCNSCLQTFYNQNALLVHRSNEHNILEGQKIVADEHFKIDFRKLRVRLDESTKDNVAHVNRRLVKIQKKKIFGAGLTGKESDDEREEDKVYLEEKLPEVIGISVDDTDEAFRSATIASDPFCAASSTGAVLGASKCIQASTVTTEGLKNDVDLLSFARGIPVLKQKPSEAPNISTDVDVSTVSNVSERIKQENSSDASNIDHAMVVQLQRNLEEAQERLKALEEAIHMQKTGESNVLHVQENKPNVTQRLSSTDEDDFPFLSPRKMQHKDDQGRFKRIVIDDDSDGVNDDDDDNDDDEDEKDGHSMMISKPKHSGTIKLNHRNCSIMEILEVKHKIMEVLCFRSPRLVLHRCDHLLNRKVTSDTKSDNEHLSPDSARSPTNSNSQSEEEDTEKQPPIKGIGAKRGRPPLKGIRAKRGRPPLKGTGAKRDREISKSSSSPNKVAAKVLSPPAELIGKLQPRSTRTRRNFAALTDHDDGSNHHSSKCKDNRFSSKYQKQKSEARKKKEEAQKKRIIGLRSRTKSLGLRSHRKNSEEGDDGEALRKKQLESLIKQRKLLKFKKSVASNRGSLHAKLQSKTPERKFASGREKSTVETESMRTRGKSKSPHRARLSVRSSGRLDSPETIEAPNTVRVLRTKTIKKFKSSVNTRSQTHSKALSERTVSAVATNEGVIGEKKKETRGRKKKIKPASQGHKPTEDNDDNARSVVTIEQDDQESRMWISMVQHDQDSQPRVTIIQGGTDQDLFMDCEDVSLEGQDTGRNQDGDSAPIVIDDSSEEEGGEDMEEGSPSGGRCLKLIHVFNPEDVGSNELSPDELDEPEDPLYVKTEMTSPQKDALAPVLINDDSSAEEDNDDDSNGERCLKLIHVFNSETNHNNEDILCDDGNESVAPEFLSPHEKPDVTPSSTLRNLPTNEESGCASQNVTIAAKKQSSPVDESFLLGLVDMQVRQNHQVRIVGKTLTGEEILVERVDSTNDNIWEGEKIGEIEFSNETDAGIIPDETDGEILHGNVKTEPCDSLENSDEELPTIEACLKVKAEPSPLVSENNFGEGNESISEPICMISKVFSLNNAKSYLKEYSPIGSMPEHQRDHKRGISQQKESKTPTKKLIPYSEYIKTAEAQEPTQKSVPLKNHKQTSENRSKLSGSYFNPDEPNNQHIQTKTNGPILSGSYFNSQKARTQEIKQIENKAESQEDSFLEAHNVLLSDQHHAKKHGDCNSTSQEKMKHTLRNQNQQIKPNIGIAHPNVKNAGQEPTGHQIQPALQDEQNEQNLAQQVAQFNIQNFRKEHERQQMQHPVQNVQPDQMQHPVQNAQTAQNSSLQSAADMLGGHIKHMVTKTQKGSKTQQDQTQQQLVRNQETLRQIEQQRIIFSKNGGNTSKQSGNRSQQSPCATVPQLQTQGVQHQTCPPPYQVQNVNPGQIPNMYAAGQPALNIEHSQIQNRFPNPNSIFPHNISSSVRQGMPGQSIPNIRSNLAFSLNTRPSSPSFPITTQPPSNVSGSINIVHVPSQPLPQVSRHCDNTVPSQQMPLVSSSNTACVPPNNIHGQMHHLVNPVQQGSFINPGVHGYAPAMNSFSPYSLGGNPSQNFNLQQFPPNNNQYTMSGVPILSQLRTSGLPGQNQPTVSGLPSQIQPTLSSVPGQYQPTMCGLPGQNQPTMSSLPGQNQPTMSALPCQNQSTMSALPNQNQPIMSGLPGQYQLTMSGLPNQNQPTMSGLPGQNQPTMSGLPGQNQPTMSGLPGQNQPTMSGLPGQNQPTVSFLPSQNQLISSSSRLQQNTSIQQNDINMRNLGPGNMINSNMPLYPVQGAFPQIQPIPQMSNSQAPFPPISGSDVPQTSCTNVVRPWTSSNTNVQDSASSQKTVKLSKNSLSKLKSIVTAFCEEKKMSGSPGPDTSTT